SLASCSPATRRHGPGADPFQPRETIMEDSRDTPEPDRRKARDRLREALGERLGGEVSGLTRMLGGASRETWAFELDGRPLVLRRDPAGAPRGGAMRREAALL